MLPQGTYKLCAGILLNNSDKAIQMIRQAEESVGLDYQSEEARQTLVKVVELNLINRKQNDRERLNRLFGTRISHNELWREKQNFCKALLEIMELE